ncbi:MAG: PQQ-dependent sugar dehydrogenase [Bdellovibrionales bacterium]|nr:PQQ-dependent sugar dehydrogenase [Bdellovibrionales bacterium]
MNRRYSLFASLLHLLLLMHAIACGGGGSSSSPAPQLTPELVFEVPGVPVDIAFTPDGRLLIAELDTGQVRVSDGATLSPDPLAILPSSQTEGFGLLGLAIDPNFATNSNLYVSFVTEDDSAIQVARLIVTDSVATVDGLVLDALPVGGHSGGKLLASSDGLLYITTGDAGMPALAKDVSSFAGKVLRMHPDGTVPESNPIAGSPIFSLGFRNVFGITERSSDGRIFVSDNGPDCDDEVNILVSGGDYGWEQDYACGVVGELEVPPIYTLTPSTGITAVRFYEHTLHSALRGTLLVADFVTGSIRQLRLSSGARPAVLEEAFLLEPGGPSILDVEVSPTGEIYFSTLGAVYRLVPAEAAENLGSRDSNP